MNNNDFNKVETQIFRSLRKIIRAVDIYSQQLNARVGLTTPQLICLQTVVNLGNTTLSFLTKEVGFSGSTVTGIIDRLEVKGLIVRERSTDDRRKIFLKVTEQGKELVAKSPSLLQDKLSDSLRTLSGSEQDKIVESLERIVSFMEVENVDASPNLIPNPPLGL
ncbi:MAG: MarR family transcriptional regulator [Deltaproteobacteria bacterium]|nr:MarR family transcriptional regulator [Deltaproteobacteria bacterium]